MLLSSSVCCRRSSSNELTDARGRRAVSAGGGVFYGGGRARMGDSGEAMALRIPFSPYMGDSVFRVSSSPPGVTLGIVKRAVVAIP